jgi:hypothetical protein
MSCSGALLRSLRRLVVILKVVNIFIIIMVYVHVPVVSGFYNRIPRAHTGLHERFNKVRATRAWTAIPR